MDWAVVVAGALTLMGVFVGSSLSNQSARKQMAVEAITKERITWLDELRDGVADLIGSCATIRDRGSSTKGDEIRSAHYHIARLDLLLNVDGSLEKEIIDNSDALIIAALDPPNNYNEIERNLIKSARILLKAEWEKAKIEAGLSPKVKTKRSFLGRIWNA